MTIVGRSTTVLQPYYSVLVKIRPAAGTARQTGGHSGCVVRRETVLVTKQGTKTGAQHNGITSNYGTTVGPAPQFKFGAAAMQRQSLMAKAQQQQQQQPQQQQRRWRVRLPRNPERDKDKDAPVAAAALRPISGAGGSSTFVPLAPAAAPAALPARTAGVSDVLKIHLDSGEEFEVKLPCRIKQVLHYAGGLLLVRQEDAPRGSNTTRSVPAMDVQGRDADLDVDIGLSAVSPVPSRRYGARASTGLFSILSPLEEPRPVGVGPPDDDAAGGFTAYFGHPEHVVAFDEARSLLLVYNMDTGRHSLHLVQRVLPAVHPDATSALLARDDMEISFENTSVMYESTVHFSSTNLDIHLPAADEPGEELEPHVFVSRLWTSAEPHPRATQALFSTDERSNAVVHLLFGERAEALAYNIELHMPLPDAEAPSVQPAPLAQLSPAPLALSSVQSIRLYQALPKIYPAEYEVIVSQTADDGAVHSLYCGRVLVGQCGSDVVSGTLQPASPTCALLLEAAARAVSRPVVLRLALFLRSASWSAVCHSLEATARAEAHFDGRAPPPEDTAAPPPEPAGDSPWRRLRSRATAQEARFSQLFEDMRGIAPSDALMAPEASSKRHSRLELGLSPGQWRGFFLELHAQYEDCKLSVLCTKHLASLARLLVALAVCLLPPDVAANYMDHYFRDGSIDLTPPQPERPAAATPSSTVPGATPSPGRGSDVTRELLKVPFDVFQVLFSMPYPARHHATKLPRRTAQLLGLFSLMSAGGSTSADDELDRWVAANRYQPPESTAQRIVLAMVLQKVTSEDLESMPFGVLVPLRSVLRKVRMSLPSQGWPAQAYQLVGRDDLLVATRNRAPRPLEPAARVTRAAPPPPKDETLQSADWSRSAQADPWGFSKAIALSRLRFYKDRRMHEVCRLLNSSRAVRLVVRRNPETTDHDFVQMQQTHLLMMSMRTMALPLGRGALTMCTLQQDLLTKQIDIPELVLAGRVPPANALLQLDLSAFADGHELTSWPHFHNGVAAGLRIARAKSGAAESESVNERSSSLRPLTRTWILYSKPPVPNYAHAGFILALGLQGHLAALTMADTYEYLAQGHEATSAAVLLGMAASHRASQDSTISKMLCLHIPSLLPVSLADLEVPAVVQVAAMSGIGLLYEGSANRLMVEFLLAEIGRRATSDRIADRESYALSSGLALGFVALGLGATHGGLAGLADLRLEDRLHAYMVGGVQAFTSGEGTGYHGGSGAHSVGKSGVGAGSSSSASAHAAHGASESGGAGTSGVAGGPPGSGNALADPSVVPSRIREGPHVNTLLTAPGAILALALIYLKSENAVVASRLAVPDTLFLLDYVRPDFLLLRVWARGLVLWSQVQPTSDWVYSQVPAVVRSRMRRLVAGLVRAPTAGAGGAGGGGGGGGGGTVHPFVPSRFTRIEPYPSMDYEGSDAELGVDDDGDHSHGMAPDASEAEREDTEQTVRQCDANIVCGACLAVGFRFAGTADTTAKATLTAFVKYFMALRQAGENDPRWPDASTMETCVGATCLALALVMAGTGDVETLQLLRNIRMHVDEVSYGQHMSLSMAIGLLFLGGSRWSISTSNRAIAVLVMAIFPKFPLSTGDNQYHLQALRHLYTLAAEERCLEAVDADSGERVIVPLDLELVSGAVTRCMSPALLPPLSTLAAVRVASPRYYPLELRCVPEDGHSWPLTLPVKRKVGHLTYIQDSEGLSGLFVRPKPLRTSAMLSEMLHSFVGGDIYAMGFAKKFGSMAGSGWDLDDDASRDFVETSAAALYECLVGEKIEALSLMLDMEQLVHQVRSLTMSPQGTGKLIACRVQQLKLLVEDGPWAPVVHEFISQGFVEGILVRLESALLGSDGETRPDEPDLDELIKAYIEHKGSLPLVTAGERLACALALVEAPKRHMLWSNGARMRSGPWEAFVV